ncbi:diguanylate cyclase [Pseudoalteromonas sp. SSM20]|uniref:diguanylate cyclase n=1 Tax=Pseudoalteromonas sp. SSM20 TaxID=3139394 RepID=UPI003BA93584
MTVFFLLLLSFSTSANIAIDDSATSLSEFKVHYYVDKSRREGLDEIKSKQFIAASNRLTLGTDAKTTWVRFSISNSSSSAKQLFLHIPEAYHTETLSLFQLTNDEVIEQHTIQLNKNNAQPLLFGGTAVFPITLAAYSSHDIYLKSDVYSHQWFTLGLYDELNSKHALVSENYDIAIMVGMLLALMLYNIILFISSRKKENIFYALYLVSGTTWIALSYGFLATLFGVYGQSMMHLHLSLLTMPSFLILFMMNIFETKRLYPTEHKALLFVLVIILLDLVFGMFNIVAALKPASTLAAIMIAVTLSVSISILRKGNPLAKYFLLGHSLFFIFNLLAIGYYKGLLPNTYVTSHGVGIGIMLESFMLAFIISYRIRVLERIEKEQAELQYQANTDPLTQLYNRRYFDQSVERLLAEKNCHTPMCIAIADIDFFKKFNDQYGHQVGDEVLVAFADILQKFTPENAIVARLGGEEFIIALPKQDLANAFKHIEHIRKQIENTRISSACHDALSITASFGISQVDSLLKPAIINADKALYRAKENGRNKVICLDLDGVNSLALQTNG